MEWFERTLLPGFAPVTLHCVAYGLDRTGLAYSKTTVEPGDLVRKIWMAA